MSSTAGQLNQVMAGNKEVPRFCFLFSNYMALAEADKYLRILEVGVCVCILGN